MNRPRPRLTPKYEGKSAEEWCHLYQLAINDIAALKAQPVKTAGEGGLSYLDFDEMLAKEVSSFNYPVLIKIRGIDGDYFVADVHREGDSLILDLGHKIKS